MRELTVVGLDVDGQSIICEVSDTGEKFILCSDERLQSAVRGDRISPPRPAPANDEVPTVLRPKDIQAKIRAGASVEQVAAAGIDIARVERFAHPVLLERSRAAEMATASHPVLADGPAILTLNEIVTAALVSRGLDPEATTWDAWRNEDGRWTVQLAWQAGRSDNVAHFRFTPGAHGGTATPFDDAASELIDPNFARPALRAVGAAADVAAPVAQAPAPAPQAPPATTVPEPVAEPEPPAQPRPTRARKRKPEVPAWEDVLLGVRSGTQP
jgi:hypothetical protein